ncbi:uncharacterized protein LOC132564721 [Ylistrum balloti]|uniref:uncharacterized protein LOC132564721 n=1 Tax=Ylistrum balloti TaxID=509963 RepID=UPI002905C1D3|nr:uncharacterized protein LOC132564721 [Ylistrum balloti]
MGVHCAIIGCSNESGRCKASFFRLPAIITNQGEKTEELSTKRRTLWLSRISRADLTPKSYPYVRVCSEHFEKGKPSPLYPEDGLDWAPSLKLGHQKVTSLAIQTPLRGNRMKQREEKKKSVEAAHSLLELFNQSRQDEVPKLDDPEPDHEVTCESADDDYVNAQHVQTELSSDSISALESDYNRLTVENIELRQKLASMTISEEGLKDNDDKVKLLTGFASYHILMTVFSFLEPSLHVTHSSALTKFQQMMVVLIRLKLAFPCLYLADIFQVAPSTISKVFLNCLNVMFVKLKPLVYWPQREEIQLTMPMEFRKHFGLRVAAIIDCFEIFIERPSGLKARAETWSNYKHHNTAKYLIAITPQGNISFISDGYGGRASDKIITNTSGFLEKLLHGDIILADRGFDIAESIAQAGCELKIPAFTKGKPQLSALDVENTRKLAHVRIHVERVIGLLRNKFEILHKTIPIDFLASTDN